MNALPQTHIVIDNLTSSSPWYYQLIPGIIPALIGLLSVIAYFIKRECDLKAKKNEVKFTLFHNQRLTAITNFINTYTPLETFFWQISYRDVAEGSLKPKEIDLIYLPLYNAFLSSLYALHLVLLDDELANFERMHADINYAANQLSELYYLNTTEKTEVNNAVNTYITLFSNLSKNNKAILSKIGNEFRYSYK